MDAALESSVIDAFLAAGIVAKLVLGTLLLASVSSWAIILYKWVHFRRVESENRRFLTQFSKAEDLEDIQRMSLKRGSGPFSLLLGAALGKIDSFLSRSGDILPKSRSGDILPKSRSGDILPKSRSADILSKNGTGPMRLAIIERTLHGTIQDEIDHQERYIHLLATIGNTAPFVGLFGTVWGIMGSFQEIGRQGSANIAVVAPGVAEALINTATGLFVAIPAAVAYNLFITKIRKMHVQLEVFSSEVVTLVEEQMIDTSVEQEVS